MQFSDKLGFLMKITQTSNKELAKGISVDPSLISLLRNGKRKQPQNLNHIKHMAFFFSRKISADYQRNALAEVIGQTAIRSALPTEFLSEYLNKWLRGNSDMVDEIIEGIELMPPQIASDLPDTVPSVSDTQTVFFYGDQGRRDAMIHMMKIIQKIKEPCPILVASDDNLDWLFEDYLFASKLQANLLEILQKGFQLQQIMPSMNFLNRYVESLRYWLPIYVTGNTKVFYYPRLRDNLYRRAAIIIPGHCIQITTGIGIKSQNHITLVSSDPELVTAYTRQYQDYLNLCHPAVTAHTEPTEFLSCIQSLFRAKGFTIQKVSMLSFGTLPKELLEQCIRNTSNENWKSTYRMYLDEIPHFEEKLKTTPYYDIAQLASAEDIRAGKVFIASPYKMHEQQIAYTPETYILHLQNILRLMDEYENYHFIPHHGQIQPYYDLFVNDEGLAFLVRTVLPGLVLEIRRPEMVQACREHLQRIADRMGNDSIPQVSVRSEIKSLIRELKQ